MTWIRNKICRDGDTEGNDEPIRRASIAIARVRAAGQVSFLPVGSFIAYFDSINHNGLVSIVNRIKNAIVPNANAVTLFVGEFLAPMWPRIGAKGMNGLINLLSVTKREMMRRLLDPFLNKNLIGQASPPLRNFARKIS